MTENGSFDIKQIKLDDILITKDVIENPTALLSLDKGTYFFDIKYGFQPGISLNQKKLRIVFSCEVSASKEDNTPFNVSGNFAVAFIFLVENLNKLVDNTKEGLTINGDLVTALANIAYSTSRGLIYTRCQGTILKDFILPILPNEELQAILNKQETT